MVLTYRLFSPWTVAWNDVVEMAEVNARAFESTPYNAWWLGPRFSNTITIEDVKKRYPGEYQRQLDAIVDHAKCQRKRVMTFARSFLAHIHKPGQAVYGAYDGSNLVGVAVWHYPGKLGKDLDRQLGRTGVKWWIYDLYIKVRTAVGEFLDYLFEDDHPMENVRGTMGLELLRQGYDRIPETYNENEPKAYEELVKLSYPRSKYVYLHLFFIDSRAQRQGFGRQLLSYTISQVPSVRTTFENGSVGPQKFMLSALAQAVPLYKSVGFFETARTAPEINDKVKEKLRMEMVRHDYEKN
ncbi:hypothetical protein TRVA0_004S02146 [Trichomonascus vanleenenianus]|uniref:uncharacterized protein n=1 Tax=Trichomonascus vanleenenianus TaxID=2268995 RepID=UPI003ECA1DF9